MYASGYQDKDIEVETGVLYETASRQAHAMGWHRPEGMKYPSRYSHDFEVTQKAIDFYEAGFSLERVCEMFGLNYSTLHTHISKRKIDTKAIRAYRARRESAKAVIPALRLYFKGLPLAEISEKTGVSVPLLQKTIGSWGLSRRDIVQRNVNQLFLRYETWLDMGGDIYSFHDMAIQHGYTEQEAEDFVMRKYTGNLDMLTLDISGLDAEGKEEQRMPKLERR